MEVIYGLIPGMIILGMVAVGILFWAARSGQYDDMDGEAHRILMDDDLEPDAEDAAASEAENSAKQKSDNSKVMPD